MIDFHSHILPGIDDGSKNVEESLLLLHMLEEQGISTVVATPHFYANEQSVDAFLQHRDHTFAQLMEQYGDGPVKICLGAEVLYYNGISRLQDLEKLCIEDTQVLLLEMPFTRWSSKVVQEVLEIANNMAITVVLAHIERYARYQNASFLSLLQQNGVLMQVNASYFIDRWTRRTALRQLGFGEIHLLGSDCHGVTNRPPRMDEAAAIIKKKYGDDALHSQVQFAVDLLNLMSI